MAEKAGRRIAHQICKANVFVRHVDYLEHYTASIYRPACKPYALMVNVFTLPLTDVEIIVKGLYS